MSTEHRDPIGKLGEYGVCPNCGHPAVKWDLVTDISRCACGWKNRKEAIENYERRVKNEEVTLRNDSQCFGNRVHHHKMP